MKRLTGKLALLAALVTLSAVLTVSASADEQGIRIQMGDGAQSNGAEAAVPVHLPEKSGENCQNAQQGNGKGRGRAAGKPVEQGCGQCKNTAVFQSLINSHQQNKRDGKIGGGTGNAHIAHDHILNDQKQHTRHKIHTPLQQRKALLAGHVKPLQKIRPFGIGPEFIRRLDLSSSAFGHGYHPTPTTTPPVGSTFSSSAGSVGSTGVNASLPPVLLLPPTTLAV